MDNIETNYITPRYRIDRVVGEGGMASVVAVVDEVTGRELALKRPTLDADERKREQVAALFRQEYHVLTQLAHPAVIEVCDFGFDGDRPFYTMELLPKGADLRARTPLPWQRVCELLIDLCGPLSVLHARRLVHRDLSPRNVCFTADGRTKLIDFGALGSMGTVYPVVGTPPCVPPEVLQGAPLTGRVDIYALGALAYYALSGRHAYPARQFTRLDALWRQPLTPLPDSLELPKAFQALITAMLSLDPTARVGDVAEVMQRAGALIGRTKQPTSSQVKAYLNTPNLIGRQPNIVAAKQMLVRTSTGRGTSCVVQGVTGSGRSRVLQAIGIEAKLQGHLTVALSCSTLPGTFAGLREIFLRLQEASPERLRAASQGAEAILAPVLGATASPSGSLAVLSPAGLHKAALECLARFSEMQPFTLLVDDFEHCDAATARLLVQLGLRARKQRCLLVVSALPMASVHNDAAQPRGPYETLLQASQVLELAPLDEVETQALLSSLFGEVQHLHRLSKWVHRVSSGLPRACMDLAQHLVDQGIVTYADGVFRLPSTLDGLQLPETVQQLWDLRFATLSPASHALMEVLSLVQPNGELEIAEMLQALLPRFSESEVFAAFDQLVMAGVLVPHDGKYACPQRSQFECKATAMSVERKRECHAKLGHAYQARGESFAFRAAFHFWHAGQIAAVTPLFARARTSVEQPSQSYDDNRTFMRTEPALDMLVVRYEHERDRGASPAELYPTRKLLLHASAWARPELVRYAPETLAQLRLDLGLDIWDSLDSSLDAMTRLVRCLEHAQARYAALPEAERGLTASDAISETATCVTVLAAPYAVTYDMRGICELNALIQPLSVLAPVLQIVADFTQAAHESLVYGATVSRYRKRVMETLAQPVPGIDELTRDTAHRLNAYYLGMEYAVDGRDDALEYAELLEQEPTFEVLALQVRRIHALMRGRYSAAQKYRARREQLALQSEATDPHLHQSLLRELQAVAYGNDYLELSRAAVAIRARAQLYPGWQPWLILALAYQHIIAGTADVAEAMLRDFVMNTEPFSHGAWEQSAGVLIDLLIARGDYAAAGALVQQITEGAKRLGFVLDTDRHVRAQGMLVMAGTGKLAEATRLLDQLVEHTGVDLAGTVMFARVCEMRAELARLQDDRIGIERMLGLIKPIYCAGKHPGLTAKFEQLTARLCPRGDDAAQQDDGEAERLNAVLQTGLATRSLGDQGEYLLSVLLTELGADRGCLYRLDEQGRPALLAARNAGLGDGLALQVAKLARERRELDDETVPTAMEVDEATRELFQDQQGRQYAHRWLWLPENPDAHLGVVLATCELRQLNALPTAFIQSLARAVRAIAA